ncbi:Scramblase, partial [Oesophagostomum dentatum]
MSNYATAPPAQAPPPPGTFVIQPGYGPPQMQMMPLQPGQAPYMTQPITAQPGAFPSQTAIWMPMPQPIEGVPPGLEYLTMVDKIMVNQIFEVMELITGFETKNRYAITNANGEQVFYALEESGCCERQCCGSSRGFTMHVVDNFKR